MNYALDVEISKQSYILYLMDFSDGSDLITSCSVPKILYINWQERQEKQSQEENWCELPKYSNWKLTMIVTGMNKSLHNGEVKSQ